MQPMPLTAGTRLGVFEILAPLGKGGWERCIGLVTPRLEREVAVKILPEKMARRPAPFELDTRDPGGLYLSA